MAADARSGSRPRTPRPPALLPLEVSPLALTTARQRQKSAQFKIQNNVLKKQLFSNNGLIETMDQDDWKLFQQTYENTVRNSFTVKIPEARNSKKKKKHVKFNEEQEQKCETFDSE